MDESKLIVFTISLSGLLLYGTFLPPVSDVATNYQTPDEKNVLREAEFIGSALLLAVAGVSAIMARNVLPVVVMVGVIGSMFATYEYAMQRLPSDKSF